MRTTGKDEHNNMKNIIYVTIVLIPLLLTINCNDLEVVK